MNELIYKGRYYLLEETSTVDEPTTKAPEKINLPKINTASQDEALRILNEYTKSNEEFSYMGANENIKLAGTKLSNMDLWNVIINYFSQYAMSNKAKTSLAVLSELQKNVITLIEKVATNIAIEYRNLSGGKSDTANYRTTDDFQYRKITAIYRHYFYFVALYNLNIIDYLNSKVESGELFKKSFVSNLDTLYDPPKITYMENGYLNPSSSSDFNNTELNIGEWNDKLNDITRQLSTGFSNNQDWNFEKLTNLYKFGFDINTKVDGRVKTINIGILYNKNEANNIKKINELINRIVFTIESNLDDLKPNLIKKAITNTEKTATEIAFGKEDIKDKLKTINTPYQTSSDYGKMQSNFRDIDNLDKEKKNVATATAYSKKIK